MEITALVLRLGRRCKGGWGFEVRDVSLQIIYRERERERQIERERERESERDIHISFSSLEIIAREIIVCRD